MKIRLVSIDGRIADPMYNLDKIKEEIKKADKDKIEYLFLPSNSLTGESLGDMALNEVYSEKLDKATTELFGFNRESRNVKVIMGSFTNHLPGLGQVTLDNTPHFATVSYLANVEKYVKENSKDGLYILCQGRGTESVCQAIYSNVKIIAYKGKILASNLKNDSNSLTYDFDPDKIYSKYPYLDDIEDTKQMFENILHLQGVGLYGKMKSMNRFKICMGVSGGLDSTVSLLACVEIFKKYKLPLKNIIGVTMPGLGTTERTHTNALELMKGLGITIEEIDLKPLLKTHLKNISQPEGKFDVTFEQTQSRERTQVLLDIANRENAIMIGTGCMSEFALGWMTYGGDHLSMYAINIGLPKTVVKMYAKWFIKKYGFNPKIAGIVKDILEGPVSPELLPIDEKGEQHEKTESLIGDYAVQDFFIYHMTNSNVGIKKLYTMACNAFPEYSHENIANWLEKFTLRFFTRAYKKNCYGDGLQLFDYSASPVTSLHIPSDIDNTIWDQEMKEIIADFTQTNEPSEHEGE